MPNTFDKQVTQLEALLVDQLAAHERLLELLGQKRLALRSADHKRVASACQLENQQVQIIAELEKSRLALVGELTLALDPKAAEPMRLSELAIRLAEPSRGRLGVLRGQLRDRMERVRKEASVVRDASEALVRHMQGLVQTIGGVMSGVGTYSRRGAPPKAALAVSTFNMTA